MKSKALKKDFYLRPVLEVARELIGKTLVTNHGRITMRARIVETEAYHESETACHAAVGKTRRNEVMFLEGGHLYVYLSYGLHFCLNVVCEKAETGAAVLIRALEPLEGIEAMRKNRGHSRTKQIKDTNIASGPGKCGQALQLNLYHNGISLLQPPVYIENDGVKLPITATTRVGITKAAALPWRFYHSSSSFISRK